MSMFTTSRMKGGRKCTAWRSLSATTAKTSSTTFRFAGRKAITAHTIAAMKQKTTTPTKTINRIGSHWKRKPAVIEYSDKRQRCNPGTVEGRREYFNRKMEAYQRQGGLCCICLKPLALKDATFEHQNGRNKIDERLWVDGKPLNGCSHLLCNQQRGSRKTKIFHYPQLERTA